MGFLGVYAIYGAARQRDAAEMRQRVLNTLGKPH
jgi:hypothetical protein